ncbi:MAG: hypothetical protein NUW07_00560 [Candidatus Saccharicenans sp.]|jgi:hypothetical protein|nr:hypothetical protein [Candidatus Saccharicenans sp.]MDH7492662.1 hypothetical protein [Candidatus Saccharicenans sp.]
MLKTFLWVMIGVGLLFGLDRLFLFMESRGWIYYRRKKPSSSALSNACLEVQQLLEPSKKYIVEIKKDEKREPQETGDPLVENEEQKLP